jgi:hypothetical protein
MHTCRKEFREALMKFGDSKYTNELIEQENYDPVDTKLRAHSEHWQYIKKLKEANGHDID